MSVNVAFKYRNSYKWYYIKQMFLKSTLESLFFFYLNFYFYFHQKNYNTNVKIKNIQNFFIQHLKVKVQANK